MCEKEQREPNPIVVQFQDLVMAKYTRGLTLAESLELKRLETEIHKSQDEFYRPLLERAKAR